MAAEIVAETAPEAAGPGDRVFGFSHGPGDNSTYPLQRSVTEHLRINDEPDSLWVEETTMHLLVPMAAGRRARVALGVTARQRRLVDDARAFLALGARQPVRLSDLAARLSCSMFRLCRAFRRPWPGASGASRGARPLCPEPLSPWSLFGLYRALEAQGKSEEAGLVKARFDKAWKRGRHRPEGIAHRQLTADRGP